MFEYDHFVCDKNSDLERKERKARDNGGPDQVAALSMEKSRQLMLHTEYQYMCYEDILNCHQWFSQGGQSVKICGTFTF